MANKGTYTEVVRETTVTLKLPQTVRVDADGLERHLDPNSPPYRRLVAEQMVEDWSMVFGFFSDEDEKRQAIDEIASWIVAVDTREEYEETY